GFIKAEKALCRLKCCDDAFLSSTVLIPGTKAPLRITEDMIELMQPGSVLVDLAADNGGHIETTKLGQIYTHGPSGVVHIGLTDMPSRLPTQASTLYSNNISKYFLSMSTKQNDAFHINLQDEVVRGSIVLHGGSLLWPPPPPPVESASSVKAEP